MFLNLNYKASLIFLTTSFDVHGYILCKLPFTLYMKRFMLSTDWRLGINLGERFL